MKTLLCALILCGWWAGEIAASDATRPTYSQALPGKSLHDGKRVGDVAKCLSDMEMAMRLMNWHVEHLMHQQDDHDFYKNDLNRRDLARAYERWMNTKWDCWMTR